MKFLRNRDDGQENAAHTLQANKKRKKDSAQTKAEDVSAFFTSTQPALAKSPSNIAPQGEHQSPNPPTVRNTGRATWMQEAIVEPVATGPNANLEDGALHHRTSSRGTGHKSTSYFSWSDSLRPPSAASTEAEAFQIVSRHCLEDSKQAPVEGQYVRCVTFSQPNLLSVNRNASAISADRMRVSSAASALFERSRPHRPPQHSSSSSSPGARLVTRAADYHTTESGNLPSSMLPIVRSGAAAERMTFPMTEPAWGRSCRKESAARAARLDLADIATQRLETCGNSHVPASMTEGPRHCDDVFLTQSGHAPTQAALHDGDHSADRQPNTVRQAEGITYRGNVQRPTLRFLAPNMQRSRVPSFSCPSLYVQQEQMKHMRARVNVDEGDDAWHAGSAYNQQTRQSDLVFQGEYDGISSGSVPWDTGEDMEDVGRETLGHVAGTAERVQGREHTGVARTGFWRPQRLY